MKKLMVVVAALACAFAAVADGNSDKQDGDSPLWMPLGLSILTPPVQLPSPSHTVVGGMINLGYGQMENVMLLDLGVINNVTDTMTGLEISAFNFAGTCAGVQLGALNVASHTFGLQIGALNFTGDLHGVQLGVLNFSSSGGAIVFPIFNLGF